MFSWWRQPKQSKEIQTAEAKTAEAKTAEAQTSQISRADAIAFVNKEGASKRSQKGDILSVIYEGHLNKATDAEVPGILEEFGKKIVKLKTQPMNENEFKNRYFAQRMAAGGFVQNPGNLECYKKFVNEISETMQKYHEKFLGEEHSESILQQYIEYNETLLGRKIQLFCNFLNSLLDNFTVEDERDQELKSMVTQQKDDLVSATDTTIKLQLLSELETMTGMLTFRINKKSSQNSNVLAKHPSPMYSPLPKSSPSVTSLNPDEVRPRIPSRTTT